MEYIIDLTAGNEMLDQTITILFSTSMFVGGKCVAVHKSVI